MLENQVKGLCAKCVWSGDTRDCSEVSSRKKKCPRFAEKRIPEDELDVKIFPIGYFPFIFGGKKK